MNFRWYERWRVLEQARAARVVVQRAAQMDDWTKLSAEELALLRWANEE